MKEFMMLFRYEPNPNFKPTAEQQQAMHTKWQSWFGNLASQAKFISTHQLGMEGRVINPDHTVEEEMLVADRMVVGGNLIVKAASFNEAVALSKASPILEMGGKVEVREILPMN